MSNTKTEQNFIKNILEELGKSNLRILNDSGDRANFEQLVKNLEYKSFKKTFKSYFEQLYELITKDKMPVPKSLKDKCLQYGAKSIFADEILSAFETSENKNVPSWYKNLFNTLGKAIITEKLIEEEPINYVSSVNDLSFEGWLKKENITTENAQKKAALHYIYTIFSGDKNKKKLQHYVDIKYEGSTITPVLNVKQSCLYYGTVLIYPSTGENIVYKYGGASVSVPEYGDKDLDLSFGTALDILMGRWYDRDTEKAPQDLGNARSRVYRYKNRAYGVAGWFTSGEIPPKSDNPDPIKVPPYNSERDKTNVFLIEKNEEFYLSNPLDDLLYRSASLPGDYSSPAPVTNLSFFSSDYTWYLSEEVKRYKFTSTTYTGYHLAYIDENKPGYIVLEPGEKFDSDGVLNGSHTIGGVNQDDWLSSFDKSNNAGELAENIQKEDLPGYVVDHGSGEVVGHPDLSIPEAEEELENQFPSHTTNPSVIGLNVYSGRRRDIGNVVDELWTKEFVETVVNVLTSPLDAVVSVHTIPLPPSISGNATVKIGNYPSKVTMSVVDNQVTSKPIGTFDIRPIYEGSEYSFADYEFTKVSLYIPYCGNLDIPASACMGKSVSVNLSVDVLSGKCTATIYIDSDVYAILSGECALKYPLHGANYSTDFSSGFTGGSFKGLLENFFSLQRDMSGFTGADMRGGLGGSITGFVNNRCVLVITRPVVYGDVSDSVNRTYECLLRGRLGDFSGYVKVSKFYQPSGDLGIATKEELSEIESLLAEGVYL